MAIRGAFVVTLSGIRVEEVKKILDSTPNIIESWISHEPANDTDSGEIACIALVNQESSIAELEQNIRKINGVSNVVSITEDPKQGMNVEIKNKLIRSAAFAGIMFITVAIAVAAIPNVESSHILISACSTAGIAFLTEIYYKW